MKTTITATATTEVPSEQLDWLPTGPQLFDCRIHDEKGGTFTDMFGCSVEDHNSKPGESSMTLSPSGMATLSVCERYRYHLYRRVADTGGNVCFVMLNPSTADAREDDATIRRCIGYAGSWGRASVEVVNLFAYRTAHPAELRKKAAEGFDIVGPRNDQALVAYATEAAFVVCAWGANGGLQGRDRAVLQLLREAGVQPYVLRLTKGGAPAHPLYLPADLVPVPWRPEP